MSKCPYCDFNSHVNETVDIDLWIKSYTNQIFQMKEDIKKYNLNYDGLTSIFFGGGTPSLMPHKIIESILNTSLKVFNFNENIEISLEANPSSYETKKFFRTYAAKNGKQLSDFQAQTMVETIIKTAQKQKAIKC